MDQAIWKKVKKFLLPYEGTASQIYLLSIPLKEIAHTLQILGQKLQDPVLSKPSGDSPQVEMSLYDAQQNNLFIDRFFDEPWKVSATIFGSADITFDCWLDEQEKIFDLEAWFWADQLFLDKAGKSPIIWVYAYP